MTLAEIYTQFENCKIWEQRYRLLIQLSRKLPQLSDDERSNIPEIYGCESRLWFAFQIEPREIKAYSDARLMQGLLMIVSIALSEKSADELLHFDIQHLFDDLKITKHLTSTRLNGLQQINQIVKNTLTQ
ncbi:SufE family protein [Phocoenobacter skyensis]|uniref:Cysteine desulfuration protein SufE n=1 Tax=Phocoenobacter skyensis TaxID=97481 RepID=A0A1H7Z3F4_9PAST|nr:SufE family protein [Pasteurella skyensis]MDP8080160.1 SufE family protein [Pasteurella skyensis]MDP8086148.1 SufE family protein [Pasteurella skyensis]MDP8163348.1 SufE family protein [Pasteurella skyensis]MDP8171132.1 SufE family protein [Pasteurella skyensis]MDP8173595.1 SufE family protein [Pasteurella skyensis]